MLIQNLYVQNVEARQLLERTQARRTLVAGVVLIALGVFGFSTVDSIGFVAYLGLVPVTMGLNIMTRAEAKLRTLKTIWINPNWNSPEDSLG